MCCKKDSSASNKYFNLFLLFALLVVFNLNFVSADLTFLGEEVDSYGYFDDNVFSYLISEEEITSLNFTLNDINFSLYDEDLIILSNFDSVSNLSENSSQLVDVSNSGVVANITGAITSSNGKSNSAFLFDGNGDGISYGDIEMDNYSALTVSTWVKTTSSSGTKRIVTKDQVGAVGNFQLNLVYGKPSWKVYDDVVGAWRTITSGSRISDGNWHHVVGVFDGSDGTVSLYVDGSLVDSRSISSSTLDDSDHEEIVIGADSHVGSYEQVFSGSIDEVAVWSRALSGSEISLLENTFLSKEDTGQWGFDYYPERQDSGLEINYSISIGTVSEEFTDERNVVIEGISTDLVVWAIGDPHIQSDLPGYRSLESAIEDTLYGGELGGESFDWNFTIVAGDYTGDQKCPGYRDGQQYMAQMGDVDPSDFYGVIGNHDGTTGNVWFDTWIDPFGERTETSGVTMENRSYVPRGEWDHYSFEAGNILFLMLGDNNFPGEAPFGRNCNGGYPAGTYTKETYDWWVEQIESHPDHIIVTVAHHGLLNTTIYTGLNEGYQRGAHGGQTWADRRGSSMIYAIDGITIDGFDENRNYVGERGYGFKQYIDENPGAIDLWVHGHTHENVYPGREYNGRGDINEVSDVLFVNTGALTVHHAGGSVPYSRAFYFEEGQDNLLVRTYLHKNWGSNSEGFYDDVLTTYSLSNEFDSGYIVSDLVDNGYVGSTDGYENYTEQRQFSTTPVLFNLSENSIALVSYNFTQDLDLSDINLEVSEQSYFVDFSSTNHEELIDGDVSLYLEETEGYVPYVCPEALSISQVEEGCISGYLFTEEVNDYGHYNIGLTNFYGGAIFVIDNSSEVSGESGSESSSSELNFSFESPSPENESVLTETSVAFNVSIMGDVFSSLSFFWNEINFSLFDEYLVLLSNFDSVSSLGESSSELVDISSNELTGDVSGASVSSSGKNNGAFTFDGNRDGISYGDIEMDNYSALTVSTWVKTTSSSGTKRIVSKDQVGAVGNFQLRLNSGKPEWKVYDRSASTWRTITSGSRISDGNWHHVVGVFDGDGGAVSLYVDGSLVGIRSISASTLDDSDNEEIVIGADSHVGSYEQVFSGTIDEVALWSRALSNSEIELLEGAFLSKEDTGQWSLLFNDNDLSNGDYNFSLTVDNLEEVRSFTVEEEEVVETILTYQLIDGNSSQASEDIVLGTSHSQTITGDSLIEFGFVWNETNFSLYDEDLILLSDFDSVSNLGEDSNQLVDISQNEIVANITGASVSSSGKNNGAFTFDASRDGISYGDIEMDNYSALTVSTWVKTTSSSGTKRIVSKDQVGTAGNFQLRLNSGKPEWIVYDGSARTWRTITFGSRISDDNWHHVVGVFDGSDGTVSLYVDGSLVDSRSISSSTLDDSDNEEIVIGADSHVGSYEQVFSGSIDEVAVWSRALSGSEISLLENTFLSKEDTGQWSFQFNSGFS